MGSLPALDFGCRTGGKTIMNGSFRFAGDLFPELSRLQQRLDEVFQTGGATNIRELARGTFPAVNVGSSPDSIEVLAFAPGVDAKRCRSPSTRGCS
jgi:HSP20 family protein